ncbi:membrane protein [Pelistega indica]|uniref:LPS-assembly protein LptD n=1 Tax=Pelistega indica TaxID=1414851 RepID=V8G274_9BURK|nr:LPS-assembly protein LptD [Pelistega indica]ETD70196.1 membrane protein [Pelistega indica]
MRKKLTLSFLMFLPVVSSYAEQVTTFGIANNNGLRLQESSRLQLIKQDKNNQTTFTDSETFKVTNNNNKIILTGGAQVRRPDAILKGERITYDRLTGEVVSEGNARLIRDGSRVVGEGLKYNVDKKTGEINSPVYRILSGGVGEARFAEIVDENHLRMDDAIYSGCSCDNKLWYIKSPEVNIYDDENEGIAKDGTLYIKGVPVFWSPHLEFTIKKERKTGWLFPTFSMTSRSGFGWNLPFFWNIAPNYDVTLTPSYYSKRGFMLGGEFRYLRPSFSGQLSGTYMPSDSKLHRNRWSINWTHRQKLGEFAGLNFGLTANYSGVSDSDYYRDFSAVAINRAQETFLDKNITLSFGGYNYWSGYLSVQKYQSLHDLTDPDNPIYYYQYERVPELSLKGERYDWGGFDVTTQATVTRFVHPTHEKYYRASWNPNYDFGGHYKADGVRYVSYTQVSYPIIRPGWYITPKIGLHASHYTTDWYTQYTYPNGTPFIRSQAGTQYKNQSRVLPIMSLDTGMTFERKTTLFGKPRTQTLEPRIYYLYIPYRYQSDIPIYDTSVSNFNFGTAFSENRYVGGWDRINDANQVTLGLTSRWLDEDTGKERMAIQVAQKFYFTKPRVFLGGYDYIDTQRVRERYAEKSRSEFLANMSVALTDTLNTEVGAQLDTYDNRLAQTYASLRWFPKNFTSLSLTYRYQREPYLIEGTDQQYSYQLNGKENISIAGQWPVTDKYYLVGRHDYSLYEKRSTQSIIGLEYHDKCCTTARVVFQRYAVSKTKSNSAVFLQVELNGLGGIGSDPLSVLRNSIPGYQNVKTPETVKSPFERYE